MPKGNVVKDKFGSYFLIKKGVNYNSLAKKYGPGFVGPKKLLHKRIVEQDNKGRLYVHFGGYHVYCVEKTAIKKGDEVFMDSKFCWYGEKIFGVSLDKEKFETWRIRF